MPTFAKRPCIEKVLDISTAHISESDDSLIKEDSFPGSAYQYEYGYFVYTGLGETPVDHKNHKAGYKKHGMSKEFISIIEKARRKGLKYVKFDCDGMTYSDLTTFEW
jgi:hypothetical protein